MSTQDPLPAGLLDTIVDSIIANGGITIRVKDAFQPNKGYAVSIYKDLESKIRETAQNISTKARCAMFIFLNRKLLSLPNHFFGAWVHNEKIYLDVTIVLDSIEEARKLAKENNQIAFWDLEKFEEVHVHEASKLADELNAQARANRTVARNRIAKEYHHAAPFSVEELSGNAETSAGEYEQEIRNIQAGALVEEPWTPETLIEDHRSTIAAIRNVNTIAAPYSTEPLPF